jgi:hypothetical protein
MQDQGSQDKKKMQGLASQLEKKMQDQASQFEKKMQDQATGQEGEGCHCAKSEAHLKCSKRGAELLPLLQVPIAHVIGAHGQP